MAKATSPPMSKKTVLLIALPLTGLIGGGCTLGRTGMQEVSAALERHAQANPVSAEAYAKIVAARPTTPTTATDRPVEFRAPETLREFVVLALRENPEVVAAAEMAQAKAARIPQVTALPDPMVMTKTLPEPVRTAEGDNFFILGISEQFPVPEKLSRAGQLALEETRAALQRLQEVRLKVIAEVKRAYFQLYVLDKSIDITQENQRLLRGLIDVARAQVAGGRRPQDDVLRAQVELSSLEAELITLRQRRVTVVARLNELLDRTPTTPVTSPGDFDIRQADLSLDQLLAKAADANPGLGRLKHEIEREEQAVKLAKLAYWPDFTLGFEWMYMEPRDAFRPPRDPTTGRRPVVSTMSEAGTDNWAITFGFSVPIWFDKIKGGISEAQHRLLATRQEQRATQNAVKFQIVDAMERFRAQRELAALFKSTIIPQAQQTYQVSQASYVAGSSDFLYVVDNWRKWLVFTIQYHRSLGELERSVADLEEAIGLSLSELGEP